MIRGGIADKLGNGYEAKWVLKQALFVLQGRVDEIRTEPVGEDAGGFEFRLTTGIHSEWHQCKSRTSKGSWTINALEQEGVLSAFARKLADPATSCVFVSSDPIKSLDGIVGKAKLFSNETEFRAGLSKDDERDIQLLRAIWKVDPATEYEWLRRCSFETVSDHTLEKDLLSFCSLLFTGDPGTCLDRLKGLFENSLTLTLSTNILRQEVVKLGMGWRAQLDPTIETALDDATQQYLDTLRPPIAGVRIVTEGTTETIEATLHGRAKFIVVTGQAGCGKSSTIAAIINTAKIENIPVLGFRIDRFLGANSIGDLGEALLTRKEDPVGVLGNRYPRRKTLLVIDQVDAISEASGRSPRARDLLFGLMRSAKFYPEMKVVLACRTYDLENDGRLTQLIKEDLAQAIHIAPLDWEAAVMPALANLHLHERKYSERERHLLSLPLNLNLLCEIAESGSNFTGEISASRLFDALLSVRARELREAGLIWTPSAALGAVAKNMSDSQELTATVATLDAYPGAIDALSSAGLISCVGTKVQFAHESFFDHVFSSHFLTLNISVAEFLRSSEQGLFRRTQVRQILFRLRDQGVNRRYLQYLAEMMNAQDVRYLVKDAVGMWLATVEAPDRKELDIVLPWFEQEHPLRNVAQVVFNGPPWLGILISTKQISRWLIDTSNDRKKFAFWLLRRGASTESGLVAAELRNWLGNAPEHTRELIHWFNNLYPDGSIGELEELYFELVNTCPNDLYDGGKFPADFELGSWAHKDCALAARVLGKWLQRWLEIFPSGHPFDQLMHSNNNHWVKEMAKKAPLTFLETVLPVFATAINRDQAELALGQINYTMHPRFEPDDDDDDDEGANLSYSIKCALRAVAASDPSHVSILLDQLPTDAAIGLNLHLHAIAANGASLGARLLALLKNPILLKAGPDGIEWSPFANAAKAAMPHLSAEQCEEIEQIAIQYRPEIERAIEGVREASSREKLLNSNARSYIIHQLRCSGFALRGLLRTIGQENLSAETCIRLAALDRKFPSEGLPKSFGSRGGWVQSPISPDAVVRMSPKQWLSAMRKYAGDDNHVYLKKAVIGGARQLAQTLQTVVKSNPAPFIGLLRELPVDLNAAYPEAIISGLGEADLSPTQAKDAINFSQRWPVGTFDRSFCRFIRRHRTVADSPEILAFLLSLAEHGAASDTAVQSHGEREGELSVSELIGRGGDLDISGLNSDRGAAYEALSNVIWGADCHLEAVIAFAEKQIEVEPLVSVRMQMTYLLNAISKYDADRGISLLLKLAESDLESLNCRGGFHMLRWAVFNYSERTRPLVNQMCAAETVGVRALGLFLLSGMALSDDNIEVAFKAMWPGDILARQVAAFRSSANIGVGGIGQRSEQWTLELLHDSEKSVRHETSKCKWSELLDGLEPKVELVKAYLLSLAFEEHPDRLVMAISERIDLFPELAIDIVQRIISLLGKWTSVNKHDHYGSTHVLGQMLINLYRAVEGCPERERQMLDLCDNYLAYDLYGTREAMAEYERH